MTECLVVAGEASGDRAAASVLRHLSDVPDMWTFGLGGAALAEQGMELVEDLRGLTALGIGEVVTKGWRALRALRTLTRAIEKRRPRAALLVNYSEFNTRLLPVLHDVGARVLWYIAPQIWAWRANRTESLRRYVDRMAVILPFEEPLWRTRGIDAHYVGHPAREIAGLDRDTARRTLGLTKHASTVAILPGSRPHEVDQLLGPMLAAYERVRHDRASVDGRVLLASSLDEASRQRALRVASEAHVPVFEVEPMDGAMGVLRAFDAALCASGTVSLEAALARAVPVIAYRVGLTTELVARLLVKMPFVGLPNILLERGAFTELLQRNATANLMAEALDHALTHHDELLASCDELEARLGPRRSPSREVARLLSPWLRLRPSE